MKKEDNNSDENANTHEDTANSNSRNPFNENEQISFNDTNEGVANVVNSPVPISSSEQISNKEEGEESSQFVQKMKTFLRPVTNQFLKLGTIFQNYLSKLSEKIQVQQSYKYFFIFLALGLLLLFFALLCIPFVIFNPGKLLRLLSFGNIFIMLCFLFYYGSKDFFAFLIDPKRTGVMFGHIVGLFGSLFVSLFIGGYFLQLLLDVVLCITTVMFILTLIPGGQEGIAGIKRMLISPLMLLISTFKGKIFGDANAST
jgi:hypothetical protein